MGLPGLNGSVGEFTILLGAFGSEAIGSAWYAGISAIGVILAAIYMLYMYQKIFLGPEGSIVQTVKDKGHPLRDLSVRELVTIVPLLVFIFWIGLYPKPFFALIAPTVDNLVKVLQAAMG
jgi:NADH-quinone oxidoreductase subunit M